MPSDALDWVILGMVAMVVVIAMGFSYFEYQRHVHYNRLASRVDDLTGQWLEESIMLDEAYRGRERRKLIPPQPVPADRRVVIPLDSPPPKGK